jgi:hypothetical protein
VSTAARRTPIGPTLSRRTSAGPALAQRTSQVQAAARRTSAGRAAAQARGHNGRDRWRVPRHRGDRPACRLRRGLLAVAPRWMSRPGFPLPARTPGRRRRLPAVGCPLPAVGCRLSAVRFRLSAVRFRLSAVGCPLPASGFRLPAPGARRPAPGARFAPARFPHSLPVARTRLLGQWLRARRSWAARWVALSVRI